MIGPYENQFFKREVNRRCRLPKITEQQAFDLWFAATGLVTGLEGMRRLCPDLPRTEVAKLVQALTWQSLIHSPIDACDVAKTATGIVEAIGQPAATAV